MSVKGVDSFGGKKIAVRGSKERSQSSSLEFRLPCTWLCSVVPPRHRSRQMPASSLAPYRHCFLCVRSFASLVFFLRSPCLPPQCLILLRCCPRRERSWIVALRQSTKNKVNRQSEDGIHVQKKIAAFMALLCSLVSASQVHTYLVVNLHSTFNYRGR